MRAWPSLVLTSMERTLYTTKASIFELAYVDLQERHYLLFALSFSIRQGRPSIKVPFPLAKASLASSSLYSMISHIQRQLQPSGTYRELAKRIWHIALVSSDLDKDHTVYAEGFRHFCLQSSISSLLG